MLFCLVLGANGARAGAPSFSVEGKLDIWVSAGSPGQQPQTGSYEFRVVTRDHRYKLTFKDPESPTNKFEYVFIDGDFYVFHGKVPTQIATADGTRQVTAADRVPYYSSVSSREIPPAEPCRPQFLWLAYLSADYFAAVTNQLTLPIWSPEDPAMRRQPFEMITYFRVSEASPHVPLAADYTNDGFYRSYNPRLGKLDVVRLSPPYDQGFTNAQYRVLETATVGELLLPVRFVFEVYTSPISPGSLPGLRLRVRGAASHYSDKVLETIGPPEFTGVASVADWRQPSVAAEKGKKLDRPHTPYGDRRDGGAPMTAEPGGVTGQHELHFKLSRPPSRTHEPACFHYHPEALLDLF